jgi:hypothetical protein
MMWILYSAHIIPILLSAPNLECKFLFSIKIQDRIVLIAHGGITETQAINVKAKEQSTQQELKNDGKPRLQKDCGAEQILADNPIIATREERKSKSEHDKPKPEASGQEKKSVFVNGLAVGAGIGCIATFVVMWITIFFSPQLPAGTTYQTLLSIFIYPLVYLLAVGSIILTAGIVREYYAQVGQTQKL